MRWKDASGGEEGEECRRVRPQYHSGTYHHVFIHHLNELVPLDLAEQIIQRLVGGGKKSNGHGSFIAIAIETRCG